MKTKLSILLTFLIAVLGFQGCTQEDKLALISGAINIGSRIATSQVIQDKPEAVPVFNAVVAALDKALTADTIAPADVVNIVTTHLNVDIGAGLNVDPNIRSVVLTSLKLALDTYGRCYTINVKDNVDNHPQVKQVLVNLKDGIKTALDNVGNETVDGPIENPLLNLADSDLTL